MEEGRKKEGREGGRKEWRKEGGRKEKDIWPWPGGLVGWRIVPYTKRLWG